MNSISAMPKRRRLGRPAFAALGAVALTPAMTGHFAAAPMVSTSTTFAGYTLPPPLGLESVSTTIKVPALTCSGGLGYSQEVGEFTDTTISPSRRAAPPVTFPATRYSSTTREEWSSPLSQSTRVTTWTSTLSRRTQRRRQRSRYTLTTSRPGGPSACPIPPRRSRLSCSGLWVRARPASRISRTPPSRNLASMACFLASGFRADGGR